MNKLKTLESEVKEFADSLPYSVKYLADKILTGNIISENDTDNSYSYLLEELNLKSVTAKPEIPINYNSTNANNYKSDLSLLRLSGVEGVNALIENQMLEFSPNLTIIYGANGSGKSGYVRLLKKSFYSKSPEDILPNVHLEAGHKQVNAKFTFKSNGVEIYLQYPISEGNPEFEQFAVFDGKSVSRHLDQKNEFDFRPSGLDFFGELTEAIKNVEIKLNNEIVNKRSGNTLSDLSDLFDGESEIKSVVQNLNDQTKIGDLRIHTPFSDADKLIKLEIEKQYDDLLLASKGKKKEIQKLSYIKALLAGTKKAIETFNQYFAAESLTKIKSAITDCIAKEECAKVEGIEFFKTDKIEGIGTKEWKNFIVAADAFAKQQKFEIADYPQIGDNCLFCHQPLNSSAEKLISNYWTYIKSVAENNARKARKTLDEFKEKIEALAFDLFPDGNILTVWIKEKYPEILITLKHKISEEKKLAENILFDIQNKISTDRISIIMNFTEYEIIESAIDTLIESLSNDEQNTELDRLLKEKTRLIHKEKFNTHFLKFEKYIEDQLWIDKANKVNFPKRKITDMEKYLSDRYFNQKYVDSFNEECKKLNGNFGVEINHTGSAGRSYRQLKLKGRNPNVVLSEGEQKVIAIADFIAEMKLSEANRGIIFDDPVNSLDNDRKKQIADRLAYYSLNKQVIIFTHDLVFFYHIKNSGKKYLEGINNSFVHHSIEKEANLSGKVILNSSPANEGQYNKPTKAEEWLGKSQVANGNDKIDYAKSGLAALRSSYEALAIFTILGGTVQRFDPQIRIGRLKDIKYEKSLIESVIEKHGEISDLIEGHLPSDEFGVVASPEILEQHIKDFQCLTTSLKLL